MNMFSTFAYFVIIFLSECPLHDWLRTVVQPVPGKNIFHKNQDKYKDKGTDKTIFDKDKSSIQCMLYDPNSSKAIPHLPKIVTFFVFRDFFMDQEERILPDCITRTTCPR